MQKINAHSSEQNHELMLSGYNEETYNRNRFSKA